MENKKTNPKILLVDDDADDRKYFIMALKEADADAVCVTATDGAQAMALLNDLQTTLPDCIFLDLRMPKVHGRQCLEEIKSNDRLKNIPVIIYTTSTEVQESEELQNLGAVRFISKPANTEEIYFMVSQALEEHAR